MSGEAASLSNSLIGESCVSFWTGSTIARLLLKDRIRDVPPTKLATICERSYRGLGSKS